MHRLEKLQLEESKLEELPGNQQSVGFGLQHSQMVENVPGKQKDSYGQDQARRLPFPSDLPAQRRG